MEFCVVRKALPSTMTTKNILLFCLFVAFSGIGLSENSFNLTVIVRYPSDQAAQGLYLRGSGIGLDWQSGKMLDYIQDDIYQLVLPFSEGDVGSIVEMKVLIGDTVWMVGSNFGITLRNTESASIFPWFGDQLGTIVYEDALFSPQLNNTRRLAVWIPPSYKENPYKQYNNLLIMHDGNNLFESDCPGGGCCPFGCWKVQDTLNSMIISGNISEIVVLGIWNTPDRDNEYTYSYDKTQSCGGKGDLYLDFIEHNVIDWMRRKYRRVSTDNISLLGSSLGGLLSCYAGMTRPLIFPLVGCMSSSFWWNNEDFNNTIIPNYSTPLPVLQVYLDSGDSGAGQDDKEETIRVRNHLQSIGFSSGSSEHGISYYLDKGGIHNEKCWGDRFYVPLLFFYGTL